ncbi:MAG: bifunctional phosphoribosyl-AMP cyclohydrolase/phosphoribosyl-ATP diphosphatase HisIE, partial [Trueperaceae bacterium]
DGGLLPVATQDAVSGELLMLAWADREAVEATLASGEAHYRSRSRNELWRKGATSGNVQRIAEVRFDCDADALLYRVHAAGPACHTGARSCFYRALGPDDAAPGAVPADAWGTLQRVVDQRLRDLPEASYVTSLHRRGLGYVAQKVVEEAGETIVAALRGEDAELTDEAADLLFHLTVLLRERGLGLDDVARTLLDRHHERSTD